jgi:hypothetical protein
MGCYCYRYNASSARNWQSKDGKWPRMKVQTNPHLSEIERGSEYPASTQTQPAIAAQEELEGGYVSLGERLFLNNLD